jgi:hypothetical protein
MNALTRLRNWNERRNAAIDKALLEEERVITKLAEPLAQDSNCSLETAMRYVRLTQPKKEKIDGIRQLQ